MFEEEKINLITIRYSLKRKLAPPSADYDELIEYLKTLASRPYVSLVLMEDAVFSSRCDKSETS